MCLPLTTLYIFQLPRHKSLKFEKDFRIQSGIELVFIIESIWIFDQSEACQWALTHQGQADAFYYLMETAFMDFNLKIVLCYDTFTFHVLSDWNFWNESVKKKISLIIFWFNCITYILPAPA